MRKLKSAAVLLMSLVLVLVMGDMKAAAAENTVTQQVTVEFRQTMARGVLDYVNALRTQTDGWQYDVSNNKIAVPPMGELTYDYTLEQIAMQRAAELVLSFSHTRPNGEGCFTAYTGQWLKTGENIAYGYGMLDTAQAVYEAWLEEDRNYSGQGHRRNMQDSSFTAIGMGCVYYNGYYFWAMELGIPGGTANTSDPGVVDGTRTVDVEVLDSGNAGGNTPGGSEDGSTPPGGNEEGSGSGDMEDSGAEEDVDTGDYGGEAAVNVDWNAVGSSIGTIRQESQTRNIDIAIGGGTEIPQDIMSSLAGSNATLAMRTGSGIVITVSGTDVKKVNSALNVSVTGSVDIPAAVRQQVTSDSAAIREFSMNDQGAYPYPMAVHINLGKENAGKKAVLYYYDEAAGAMKSVGSFLITESGQAMFGMARGGQYIVVAGGQAVLDNGGYTVASGDTFYGIAKKNGVSYRALREANSQISNLDKIYPGQKINIP